MIAGNECLDRATKQRSGLVGGSADHMRGSWERLQEVTGF